MAKTCLKTSIGKALPSLPVVVFRLIKATDQDSQSLKNLADLASKDPVLSAQILRLANSPLMNVGKPVKSMAQAALNLGVPTIRNLAVTVAVCQSFSSLKVPGNFSITDFWNHSLSCAVIAKLLAEGMEGVAPEEAFLAGLLHDLGQLVMVIKRPSLFDKIVQNPRTGQTILDSELKAWGTDHVSEGCRLLESWHIHQAVTDAVRYHHRDVSELASSTNMVKLVHAADLFSHFMSGRSSLGLDKLKEMAQRLGVISISKDVDEIFLKAKAEMNSAARELGLRIESSEKSSLPKIGARYRTGQDMLAEMALDLSTLTGTLEAILCVRNHEQLEKEIFSSVGLLTNSSTAIFFLWKNRNLVGCAARGTRDDALARQLNILGLEESIWEEAFLQKAPIHSHIFFKKYKKRIIDQQIEDYAGGDFLVLPLLAWGERVGVLVVRISWQDWVELEPGKDFFMVLAREIAQAYKGLKYRQLYEKEHLINETIIKKSPVGIVLCEHTGEIIFCNPAGRVLLGLDSLKLKDLNIFSILGITDDKIENILSKVSSGRTADLGRLRLEDSTHGPLWIGLRLLPVTIMGKDRLLFLLRDLTAEVLLELERKERALWLEKELQKKSAELEEAQKKLIQAERLGAASQLARKVVHEVNNPLGIIKNFLKILKIQKETGEIEDRTIDAINSEIDRVARILRELGNFSKTQQEPQVKGLSCSLESVVRDVELLVKPPLGEKGISFETQIAKDLPPVGISADSLKQILLNLIKNAEEALNEPGRIVVKAMVDEGDQGNILIEVADTGPGISEEIRDKIFDPFVTTKEGENSGLGLSVCYGIVKAHGGEIWFSQDEEFTTVVKVKLPSGVNKEG